MEVRIFQAEDVKSIKEQKKRFLPGIKRSAILLECRLRGGRNLARHAWIRPCSVLQDRLQNWRDKPVDSPVDRPLEPSHGDETSVQFSTVQSLSRVWLFAIPWTAAHQASLSITNSWSLLKLMSIDGDRWCHPTISSSVIPFSSCLQFFPASGSFPISQFFASGIGVSASTSDLPMNTLDWSLGWTGWISLQSKWLLRVFSNTTVQKHQFFGT